MTEAAHFARRYPIVRRRAARVAAALLLAALGATAWAEEPANGTEVGNAHFSGFGTLGVSHLAAPAGWGFLRDSTERANQGGTRADIDTRLGVQANYRVSPQIELVGQLVAANREPTTRPSDLVSMAFASYSPVEDVAFRIGRLSADYYLLADYRNVGFAYPYARPPVESYAAVPYSLDGADLTKTWHAEDTVWKLRGSVGNSEVVNDRLGTRIAVRPAYSLMLSRDDGEGVLLKASATRVQLRGDTAAAARLITALRPLAALPAPGVAADVQNYTDLISYDGRHVNYLALGASLDRGPWLASLELSLYKVDGTKRYTAGWGFIGHRWGPLTTYAGLSAIRTTPQDSPPEWTAALTPLIGAAAAAQAQQLGNIAFGAVAVASANARQHTVTLGVRWDLSDRTALKLQYDRIHVGAYGSRYWTAGSGSAIDANLGSVTLDFVF